MAQLWGSINFIPLIFCVINQRKWYELWTRGQDQVIFFSKN
jgi:hypothetical protein